MWRRRSVRKYTAEQATKSAARGAKWMDSHCPGWANRINRELLDLSKGNVCILGQTAECVTNGAVASGEVGSYRLVVKHFGHDDSPISSRSFVYQNGFSLWSDDPSYIDWEMLTIAWKMEILSRLS